MEQSQLTKIRPDIPTGSVEAKIGRRDRTLEMWEENQAGYDTVVIGDMIIDYLKWDIAVGMQKDLIEIMNTRIAEFLFCGILGSMILDLF